MAAGLRVHGSEIDAPMDAEAGCAAAGVTAAGPSTPPEPGRTPENAAESRFSEAPEVGAGGGDEVSKSGADAVILDVGNVSSVPEEDDRKQEPLDVAAFLEQPQGGSASVTVDVKSESVKVEAHGHGDGGESLKAEKECRICHVSPDQREKAQVSEMIELGCGCKGDLGIAHRHCAEAWFKLKGNRCCEICGATAKNITGIDDANFLLEWNDTNVSRAGNANAAGRGRCWRGQPLCNFLMACLVIAFILPWFFRINMF